MGQQHGIGILGAGSLAGFLLSGLQRAGFDRPILLSPRGRSAALSDRHGVPVAASNQDLVDRCDRIIVCLPADTATEILQTLTFRSGQIVLSAVARLRHGALAAAVAPAGAFCTMMPGHANGLGIGPSILYPPDDGLRDLLTHFGPVHVLETEELFQTASCFGGLSGASFLFMRHLIDWFTRQGLPETTARALVAEMLRGNATVLCEEDAPLDRIVDGVATPGGITWQCVTHLRETGGFSSWGEALDSLLISLNKSPS